MAILNVTQADIDTADQELPAGTYTLQVTSTMDKISKAGNEIVILELIVTEGEHEGTEVSMMLNLYHENAKVRKISYKQLGDLQEAIGQVGVFDTDEYLGIPFVADVDYNGSFIRFNNLRPAKVSAPPSAGAARARARNR